MAKKKIAEAPIDLEAELGALPEPSHEDKAAVTAAAEAAVKLMVRIEKGEELLKDLKAELNVYQITTIPNLLARAGTSTFSPTYGPLKGWKLESQPMIAGSLPKITKNDDTDEKIAAKKEKRERGLNFIREEGADDIIKTTLTVVFERGQDNLLGVLRENAKALGLAAEVASDVHHKTLASFAIECVKNGRAVPFEDLGLYPGRTTKITPPKKV